MRVVKEIPHPDYKITLYAWNNRYIIKIEQGFLEQTYKIDQFELANENELEKILNPDFTSQFIHRFGEMAESLYAALQKLH